MTDFERLNNLFLNNELQAISNDKLGYRYFLVKSMSRNDLCKKFLKDYSIKIPGKTSEYVLNIFNSSVSTNNIEYFILEEAKKEKITKSERDYLIDQLSRLKIFDWGGSYQNALEKNIVNNYVKKIKSYDDLNKKVDTSILEAVRGYTFNSWYNHWTTILIEDIFNDVEDIIPAIGKIEKIDFFIKTIPFDLKVTYFPEEYLENELKIMGFGVELTQMKKICRECNIFIPNDLNNRRLKEHLYTKLSESSYPKAQSFIKDLNGLKSEIITKNRENPYKLKVWLYENQGEKRFDASNRFFMILVDQNNMYNSWKLKRNLTFIKNALSEHIGNIAKDLNALRTTFTWNKNNISYNVLSDILFLIKE